VRAASNQTGAGTLYLPQGYDSNRGTASLAASEAAEPHDIAMVRLDDIVAGRRVGVMKLDVEGQEMVALEGAARSLERRLIRDIFFEEHQPLPSGTSALLCLRALRSVG
jgi:FkbM family methyltransferase